MGEHSGGRRFDLGSRGPWRVLWQRGEDAKTRRQRMVEAQIRGRDIAYPAVLEAMAKVPRHLFVRPEDEPYAYDDRPLAIGPEQTISQPYIVALMTQLLHPRAGQRVLEIGTGSGYQAAVLAEIVAEVYSVELQAELADEARRRLEALGVANVRVRQGDGYRGWPEEAPFDGIVVTCAVPKVPAPLVEQLGEGGRLVIPLGPPNDTQDLWVLVRRGAEVESRRLCRVMFVPLRRPEEP